MKKKIMVIDDMADTVEATTMILELHDFEAHGFTDAKKALDALHKGVIPAVILLDVRMPEISGPEFCKRLKEDEKLDDIKVVFFTASNDDETLVQTSGAAGLIFKPFEQDDLIKQINKIISKN